MFHRPGIRPRKCKHCKESFLPERLGQIVHRDCIEGYMQGLIAKKKAAEERKRRAQAKIERAQIRRRKEALKTLRQLVAEAQKAFNLWVHARDHDQPCISCGVTNPPMTAGGQWDAGHFKSRGAHPEMRFVEDNCHRQCKSCNAGGGKYAHKERTVTAKYEAGLLERIGPERLAALKAPRPVVKLTREELIEIREKYKQKLKELRK